MGAGAGVYAGSDDEEMGYASGASSNANSSQSSMFCPIHNRSHESENDDDASVFQEGRLGDGSGSDGDQYTDDASMASEESFPDDDDWNQYNEDEELDAEVRFRKFEELLEAESDIGYDERKLQYTNAATTTNNFQVRNLILRILTIFRRLSSTSLEIYRELPLIKCDTLFATECKFRRYMSFPIN
jgi:hypothetical protein